MWVSDGVYRDADEADLLSSAANFLGKAGEPGRNRTFNPQIKSLLLCQLSYWPRWGKGKR
jgi:hypothetical protein